MARVEFDYTERFNKSLSVPMGMYRLGTRNSVLDIDCMADTFNNDRTPVATEWEETTKAITNKG